MIVYRNRYVKKHVIGGSGILDTLKNILRRAATSSASRAASTLASRIAKTELGREAIMATKSAGKELASTAISTAKDVAIDKGRKTIEKLYTKTGRPKPVTQLSQKSKDIISGIVSRADQSKMDGKAGSSKMDDKAGSYIPAIDEYAMLGGAIRIQDLVKNSKNLKMGNGLLIA